ncbi:MAG: FtsX-like permease family protein [Lachnospiraceae bacterium]|nr:FtsX-like permease family protein [Lachnospiraceae bacterium]
MSNVKNQKMIKLLAQRELRTSKRMNIVLILSVVLTCVMFTCIASVGGNLLLALRNQTMRMVGGDRMAGLKYVLPADYEKVLADGKTRDVVYRIIVGRAINEDFQSFGVELNCAGDDRAAQAAFSLPSVGRLPEKMDEMAPSTMVLEALGLPSELGTRVPLKIDIDGRLVEKEFTVCGFWEGDSVAAAQLCWVSREFADYYVPTPEGRFTAESYGGYWQVDFNFSNGINIEGQLEALLDRIYGAGEMRPDTGVNWAYGMNLESMDPETVAGWLLIVLVVFFAGYLVIYNIFQINVTANIQKYGLLKTIGTTPAQIRKLVRLQADLYAAIGIPAGLLIGIFLGKLLYRYIQPSLYLRGNGSQGLSLTALVCICLFAALFSLGTVRLSANKPAKMAGKASPMEALRFSETKLSPKKSKKKSRKVSPFSIAQSNMARSRKKTITVIVSLTLSMALFVLVVTALHSLDMDKMLANLMIGDFNVLSGQPLGMGRNSNVALQDIETIRGMDGVEACQAVYYEDAELILSGKSMEQAKKLYEKHSGEEKWKEVVDSGQFDYSREVDQYITLRNLVYGAPFREPGVVNADLYCVDPGMLEFLLLDKGTPDEGKFASGKYAIVFTDMITLDSGDESDAFYEVGDKLILRAGGKEKEYEVLAIGDIPYVMSTKVYQTLYGHVILPESEWNFFSEGGNAMNLLIKVRDGQYEAVRENLQALTDRKGLVLRTKQDCLEEFRELQQTLSVVGGAMTVILAVIAVMNFVNATVTGVISRKKELVVMQAVGMTGKQVKQMLIWEGVTYAFWTIVSSMAAGLPLAWLIMSGLEKESAFFTYHFTVMPLLICAPVLLAIAFAVPLISFRWVARGNTVNVTNME